MRTQTAQQEVTVNLPLLANMAATFGAVSADAVQVPVTQGSIASAAERDELVLAHLPVVRFVARRIHERVPPHIELDDLIAAGLLGLIDAASRFDGNKQVQFKSYAQFRIRGAILDSLRTLDWSPRDLRRKGREMAEAIRTLSARLGRTPAELEVAQEMGIDLADMQLMTGELKGLELGSLYVERDDEGGQTDLDVVAAPASEDPLACCIAGQTREQLAAAIQMLPEKERLILTLSYYEELTLKEIGLVLGVVESRVCQIRATAINRLRKLMVAPGKESKAAKAGSPKSGK